MQAVASTDYSTEICRLGSADGDQPTEMPVCLRLYVWVYSACGLYKYINVENLILFVIDKKENIAEWLLLCPLHRLLRKKNV